ncbi:MAG: hypothetical protein ACM3WU_10150 [Bacillota bacterium]
MEAVKVWARAIFLLSVIASTALLVVPKSMQKQSRFVVEMLILLCVIAPLHGLIPQGTEAALAPNGPPTAGQEVSSLGKFYANETARRVAEIGEQAGVPVLEVTVLTGSSGFSLSSVVVRLREQPSDERLSAFTGSLAAYLGIGKDRLRVVVDK